MQSELEELKARTDALEALCKEQATTLKEQAAAYEERIALLQDFCKEQDETIMIQYETIKSQAATIDSWVHPPKFSEEQQLSLHYYMALADSFKKIVKEQAAEISWLSFKLFLFKLKETCDILRCLHTIKF